MRWITVNSIFNLPVAKEGQRIIIRFSGEPAIIKFERNTWRWNDDNLIYDQDWYKIEWLDESTPSMQQQEDKKGEQFYFDLAFEESDKYESVLERKAFRDGAKYIYKRFVEPLQRELKNKSLINGK